MKFEILEKGRLDKDSMEVVVGGKVWENCSDSGTACPMVAGNNFSISACAYYITCGSSMKFCVADNDLRKCSGLPSDEKLAKIPN